MRRWITAAAARYVLYLLALLLLVAPLPAQAVPVRILAFGDSLMAGYGLAPEQAFPARLQARLVQDGIDAQVANAGVSGDTTTGGLTRLDWALGDKPDLVLVELGANDALRGIDPKLTYDNLDKILARIRQSGAKLLLLGMKAPANWGRDYDAEFDAIYPKLAEKYHVALYPFFLEGVALDPALNQADGIHPNLRGVDIVVSKVAPYVERLLHGKTAQG